MPSSCGRQAWQGASWKKLTDHSESIEPAQLDPAAPKLRTHLDLGRNRRGRPALIDHYLRRLAPVRRDAALPLSRSLHQGHPPRRSLTRKPAKTGVRVTGIISVPYPPAGHFRAFLSGMDGSATGAIEEAQRLGCEPSSSIAADEVTCALRHDDLGTE